MQTRLDGTWTVRGQLESMRRRNNSVERRCSLSSCCRERWESVTGQDTKDNNRTTTTTDEMEWIVRDRSNKDRRKNQLDRKAMNRGVGRMVDNSTMKAMNNRSPLLNLGIRTQEEVTE